MIDRFQGVSKVLLDMKELVQNDQEATQEESFSKSPSAQLGCTSADV